MDETSTNDTTTGLAAEEESGNNSMEEETTKEVEAKDDEASNGTTSTDGKEDLPVEKEKVDVTDETDEKEVKTANKNTANEEKENIPTESTNDDDGNNENVVEEDTKAPPPPPPPPTSSDVNSENIGEEPKAAATRSSPSKPAITTAAAATTTNNSHSHASLPPSPAHSQLQTQPQPQTPTTITTSIPNKPSQASTEIIHSLFGPSVGVCWGDFSCQYNHVRGRLYASSEAVLFYSNLFGFEKKINLSYSQVEQMNLFRQTSIQVTLQDEQDYVFKSFSDRSQTLALLIQLWRESQGFNDEETTQLAIAHNRNSTVSEPIQYHHTTETNTNDFSPKPPIEVQTPQSLPYTPPTAQSQTTTHTNTSTNGVTRATNHHHHNPTLLPDLPSALRKRSKSVPNLHRRRKQSPNKTKSNKPQQEPKDTNNKSNNNNSNDDHFDWEQSPTESDRTNWKDAKLSTKHWVKEIGIESMLLNCSLQTFFELFLANNAPYSLEKYQTSNVVKDRNVRVTFWENITNTKNILTRLIEFEHPVSASFGVGPSHAPTKRFQTLSRYPRLGICVTSKTTVEGLPGSECFEVEDVWFIEQTDENNANEIRFSARFGANFFKFTFLKSVIDKNIKAGNKEWYEGYRRMVETALEETQKGVANSTPKVPPDTVTAPTASSLPEETLESKQNLVGWIDGKAFALSLMICQIFVLLVMVFLLYELRLSHRTSEALLEELKLLRLQHGQVLNRILLEGETR